VLLAVIARLVKDGSTSIGLEGNSKGISTSIGLEGRGRVYKAIETRDGISSR
jgi:hypothetical protein